MAYVGDSDVGDHVVGDSVVGGSVVSAGVVGVAVLGVAVLNTPTAPTMLGVAVLHCICTRADLSSVEALLRWWVHPTIPAKLYLGVAVEGVGMLGVAVLHVHTGCSIVGEAATVVGTTQNIQQSCT